MSIKPEFSLRQVKESFKTNRFEVPKGAFVGRLYWSDFSKYIPSGTKLDGCYVITDNKLQYHRKVEFIISSLETAELLLKECAQSNLVAVRKSTATVIGQMRGWVGGGVELLKPIVNAVKSAVTAVKETVVNAVKSVARRFPRWQPQSWDKCTTPEQVQFLFDRCPSAQRTDRFIANYIAAFERVSPKPVNFQCQLIDVSPTFNLADLIPAETQQQPIVGLSLDDVAPTEYIPGEVQMESIVVEHIPASENQVRKMFAEGYKLNYNRRAIWVKAVNHRLPVQYVIKFSKGKRAEMMMEQVIQCVLLAQLSVQELSSILAA